MNELIAASAGVALLETDATLVGQFMVSRPLVAGPLVGLACGNLQAGAAAGVCIELLSLGEVPVGGVLPMNAAVAAGSAVLLADAVGLTRALPAGVALGLCHRLLESRLRGRRAALSREAEAALAGPGQVPWARLLLRSVGAHFVATAVFVWLGVSLLRPVLAHVQVHKWLTLASEPAAWVIGLGSLLHLMARKA